MRVEKVELIGFKSFADKTTFNLHPGITCIVGPNGCGKSNIVDAFRWVLGEQSAKSLRGEKMEEVIFNGSTQKKPKGMAEVTLVVSGMNGVSPQGNGGGADSVIVTRRLYRSGESEYMLNRQPCRLKDVKDVFLDTGLDFRSYSILEQGRIGAILNSKPLERRFIIEEVAGVMKYKVRRAEALSKLESSRTNLVRVSDIIAEVRKQINILDRLAKKAERFKKLQAELHAIELKIARREYEQLKDALASIIGEHTGLRETEAVMTAEITAAENRTEARRVHLVEKEKALEAVQNSFQALERDIAEINRLISVSRQDISNFEEFHGKLIQQTEEIDQRLSELSSRLSELEAGGAKLAGEIESATAVLREKVDAFRAIEEELAAEEERIEDMRRQLFRISEEISRMRNELGRHQSSLESLERREVISHKESGDARTALDEIEAAIAETESEMLGRTNEALLLKEKKEIVNQELTSDKASLEHLTKEVSDAREELASSASRLESLREIVFDKPTRELLASDDNVRFLASVSDVFEVQAEYERAIENALSEKADSFVVESTEDIERAVASLRGKALDKAAFIAVSPPPFSSPGRIPEGIIVRALDVVRVRDGYAKVAENLLGNILIVSDVRTALDLRQGSAGFIIVTMTGEVIDFSGAVIVGGERGIFRRKREIRELERLIEEKKNAVEQLSGELRLIQEGIQIKEEQLRAVDEGIHSFEKELSLSRLTVDNYISDKERIGRKLSYLTIELEEISREKESVKAAIARDDGVAQALEEKKDGMQQEMTHLQEGIASKKEAIEVSRSEVTDLKMQVATNRERLESVRTELESSLKMREDLEKRREDAGGEIDSILSRITQRKGEIAERDAKLRTLVAEADTFRQDIAGRKEEIEKENEDLLGVEHELRTGRQRASLVTARISELDVSRAEHKMKIGNLTENVRDNYGVEIDQLELLDITPEEEARRAELRAKIEEIGPVNLGTLDEYEELRTRYDFMTRQQDDLTKSIAELEEAITKINSTTRKKLREAFEALKAKFTEVFTTLFGGGRAELILTDESNILETGIDIIAQPPGKKIQNIHLLSGGEQALTALALQFASFLIKPTPLCILDEADAPLDESNTERYSKMLQELSRGTQFIVVTHNRMTMNAAQHLYGITMEEAGVSKVISMQLAEI